MPNLIYLSREKSKTSFHHFKAGALNVLVSLLIFEPKCTMLHMLLLLLFFLLLFFFGCVLKLRVSAAMTNAPIIPTLDCDMYSNDPQTPLRALCYLLDPKL